LRGYGRLFLRFERLCNGPAALVQRAVEAMLRPLHGAGLCGLLPFDLQLLDLRYGLTRRFGDARDSEQANQYFSTCSSSTSITSEIVGRNFFSCDLATSRIEREQVKTLDRADVLQQHADVNLGIGGHTVWKRADRARKPNADDATPQIAFLPVVIRVVLFRIEQFAQLTTPR
jgi:hypothetical protein